MTLKNDHTYKLIEANISTGANEKKKIHEEAKEIRRSLVSLFCIAFYVFQLSCHMMWTLQTLETVRSWTLLFSDVV